MNHFVQSICNQVVGVSLRWNNARPNMKIQVTYTHLVDSTVKMWNKFSPGSWGRFELRCVNMWSKACPCIQGSKWTRSVISFRYGPTPRLPRCSWYFLPAIVGHLKKILAFTSDIHGGKAEKTMRRIAGDASCTDVAKEKSTQDTDMIHPVDGKNCLQRFGEVLTYLQVDSFLVWRVLELDSKEKGGRKVSLLLGTWVKSSSVVRSRPFVVSTMGSETAQHHNASLYPCYRKLYLHTFEVSTMGSVTAQHYNVSFYACYNKLYLNETHRDTVMFMLVLSWHRPCCTVDLHIAYLCIHMCIHAYTQTVA